MVQRSDIPMDQLNYTLSKPALLPVQFDEYCDIVGGQTWASFSSQLSCGGHEQRIGTFKRLKHTLFGENNLLNNDFYPQRLVLERFYIKTSLVIKLCQIVKDSHLLLNAPIGILNPETVRLNVSPVNTLTPNLWNYQMALCGQVDNHEDRRQEYSYSGAEIDEPNPLIDLYTIGIMLFRALLVNDDQSFDSVKITVNAICDKLYSLEQQYEAAESTDGLVEELVEFLDVELAKPIFQQNNISYSPDKSNVEFCGNFVWKSILATGFRLITNIPDFSYYNEEAELNIRWGAVEHVLNDLIGFQKQIKSALFFEPLNTSKNLKELLIELTNESDWGVEIAAMKEPIPPELGAVEDFDQAEELIDIEKAFNDGSSLATTGTTRNTIQNLNETVIQQKSAGRPVKDNKKLTNKKPNKDCVTKNENHDKMQSENPGRDRLDETTILSNKELKNKNLLP